MNERAGRGVETISQAIPGLDEIGKAALMQRIAQAFDNAVDAALIDKIGAAQRLFHDLLAREKYQGMRNQQIQEAQGLYGKIFDQAAFITE